MELIDVLRGYLVITGVIFAFASLLALGNFMEWKFPASIYPDPERSKRKCKRSLRFATLSPLWPVVPPWALYRLIRFAFTNDLTL